MVHRLLLLVLLAGCAARRFERTERHMGTAARIVLYAAREREAEEAFQAAFDRIAALERVMSDYRADSEVMLLCARASGAPVRVSDDLFSVLEHAQIIARDSGGAFDVTVGPLTRLWRRKQLPDEQARARVGWQGIELDPRLKTVRLKRAGMLIDLGGIGKGFAADEALATLERRGIRVALVDLGGDIVVGDPPEGAAGWRIDVHGRVRLLRNRAVAASGDTERFLVIDGKRYSHILDPRTGLGLTHRMRVTVVARTGMEADALASAISVLGEKKGAAFARKRGAEVHFAKGEPLD